jgi:hypothetical protein
VKNLVSILFFVFAITFTAEAQKKKGRKSSKMTTEQKAILKVKKMTLALDLSTKQQKEITPLIIQQIEAKRAAFKERKAIKKSEKELTSDELFTIQNNRLDAQIMMKNKMQKILTPSQFKKFKKMLKAKKRIARKKMKYQKSKKRKKKEKRIRG